MPYIQFQPAKLPYEEIYAQNFHKVVHYLNKKIGNQAEAEDLASEVFLYAYQHYDGYDPEKSSVNTWLYMIVNCRLKNYYRDTRFCEDLETVAGTLPADGIDLDQCLYLESVNQKLNAAIDMLPDRQAKIVRMRYFSDLSCQEIAQALNMSHGNVRVLLHRSIKALKVTCGELLEGE